MSELNPTLSKLKLPGRIFQLPSRGLLYSNNELSPTVTNGEIHVHAMNAFDEITLKNPDMLFSGKALDPVCLSSIEDVKKPIELLAKDVDALMLFLRLVTYGPSYEILARHWCDEAKPHSYTVDLEALLARCKYLDPTMVNSEFEVILPNGQRVELRPAKYHHLIEVLQANQGKEELTVEDMQHNMRLNLLSIIKAIDGDSELDHIAEWIHLAPASYVNQIAAKLDALNEWGLDLKVTLTCRDCGEEFELDLPINPISFFG